MQRRSSSQDGAETAVASCVGAKRRKVEKVPLRRRENIDRDWDSDNDDPSGLLPPDIMSELVDFYYLNIHHWIPILHVARFRRRMESEEERPRIACILHAIIAICVRFSQNGMLKDEHTKARIAEKSRQRVILNSIETFSVENLQALIIVAFETIGRGRGPSSWSIIGNMVGTVEQLQLNVEEDELYGSSNAGETLIRRMLFLTPSKSWSEAEERRRVFWTVFLMDRFCSVSTGWKMSLTGADIKRRLPCEGAIWGQEQEVRTPYFGISDSKGPLSSSSGLFERQGSSRSEDQDSIGGLAYNIEATESLALVTNFFLHHAFVVNDTEKARLWLMKFKELDLRLIQWKLYLPSKWREASVLNADGIMDPNLILAHLTHNTAVILLHQGIAYPPAHWQTCAVKPPSASSAETCLEAASETARIGQQFLAYSPIFTNPQFSFCLFIAGRMLLAHSRYNQVPISPVLDTLIASLLEISQRWAGPGKATDDEGNLASSFAKRLVEAQSNSAIHSRPSLDIRQTAYSDESKEQPRSPATGSSHSEISAFPSRPVNPCISQHHFLEIPAPQDSFGYDPFSLAFPPLPPAFQQEFSLSACGQGVASPALLSLALPSYHADPLSTWQSPSVNYGNAVISPGNHTPSPGHLNQ
ncbi:hypothetical protein N8T08_011007 [Aspergillus melleus]|uniref:Uncharacterized protein n=1 Tax=Aspergillus melleus TaxID=138277 RepID=A0ACC3AQB1_9EURO|nr:hypothetical protein N8T08_011007 [Aspergillus melleus]